MKSKQVLFLMLMSSVFISNYQLGMEPTDTAEQKNMNSNNKQEAEERECPICLTDTAAADFITLACTHEACKDCLNTQLDLAITEKNTKTFACPNDQCRDEKDKKKKKLIPYEDILKIIQTRDNNAQKQARDAVDEILTKQVLEADAEHKQCPTPGCNVKFLNAQNNHQRMCCIGCKKNYCSDCLLDHDPKITCAMAKENKKKDEKDNREAEEWLEQNSAQCPTPNCRARTERINGCDKVECPNCKCTFCWRCLEITNGYLHKDGSKVLAASCTIKNPVLMEKKKKTTREATAQPAPQNVQQPAAEQPRFIPIFQNRPINNPGNNGARYNYDDFREVEAQNFLEQHNFLDRYYNLSVEQRMEYQNQFQRVRQPIDPMYANLNARLQLQILQDLENGGNQGPNNNPDKNFPDANSGPRNFQRNPVRYIKNHFNPAYLLLAIPPVLVALRIVQWVKYPAAIKNAIATLNGLIDTAESDDPTTLLGQLNRNEHMLTLSDERIAQLRELALRDQYKEFVAFATQYKTELQHMTAVNAGFTNGVKKIRWGLSADLINAKQWALKKLGRA